MCGHTYTRIIGKRMWAYINCFGPTMVHVEEDGPLLVRLNSLSPGKWHKLEKNREREKSTLLLVSIDETDSLKNSGPTRRFTIDAEQLFIAIQDKQFLAACDNIYTAVLETAFSEFTRHLGSAFPRMKQQSITFQHKFFMLYVSSSGEFIGQVAPPFTAKKLVGLLKSVYKSKKPSAKVSTKLEESKENGESLMFPSVNLIKETEQEYESEQETKLKQEAPLKATKESKGRQELKAIQGKSKQEIKGNQDNKSKQEHGTKQVNKSNQESKTDEENKSKMENKPDEETKKNLESKPDEESKSKKENKPDEENKSDLESKPAEENKDKKEIKPDEENITNQGNLTEEPNPTRALTADELPTNPSVTSPSVKAVFSWDQLGGSLSTIQDDPSASMLNMHTRFSDAIDKFALSFHEENVPVSEFLETESEYFLRLGRLFQFYCNTSRKRGIDSIGIEEIFKGLSLVAALHEKLAQECISHPYQVLNIFIRHCEEFVQYSEYMTDLTRKMDSFVFQSASNDVLGSAISSFEKRYDLSINTLMIEPLRRLPVYVRLFRKLSQHGEDEEKKSLLKRVTMDIRELCRRMEYNGQEIRSTQRLDEVRSSIKLSNIEFWRSDRVLKREGHVLLRLKRRKYVTRDLSLFSDVLVWTSERRDKAKGYIRLSEQISCKIDQIMEGSRFGCCGLSKSFPVFFCSLENNEGKELVRFYFVHADQAKSWSTDISDVIDSLRA